MSAQTTEIPAVAPEQSGATIITRRDEVMMLVEKVRTYPENFMHFLAGEIEDMDRSIVHLCDVLEIVRAENVALRALVKSATKEVA